MTIARLAGAASVCAFPWLPAGEWLETWDRLVEEIPQVEDLPAKATWAEPPRLCRMGHGTEHNPCYAIDAGVGITLYDSSAQGLRPRYGWSNSQGIVGTT